MDRLRRSGRGKFPTEKYTNYKLYVTVAGEDEFLLATNGDKSNDKNNGNRSNGTNNAQMYDEALSAVAHYVMVHYAEKEMLKKQKKRYKPKAGQYALDTGLRKFGSRSVMAVAKELHQFNTYKVFELLDANSLSEEEKKALLLLHIP